MSSSKYVIVYNTSPDSIPCDDEGRQVAPQAWAAVQRSKVQEHIGAERLIVVDPEGIRDESNQMAREAKADLERLESEWEAEKSAKEPQATRPDDYDDDSKESKKTTSKSSQSKK